MTASGGDHIRATDADRDTVHEILQNAYAEGRLSWEEFDSRSTAVRMARTYGELAAVTADLPTRIPGQPPQAFPGFPGQPVQPGGLPMPANGLAVASLACGVFQIFAWGVGSIAAIVLGHLARRQIRRTGQRGGGMAMAGLILGYGGLILTILIMAVAVIVFLALSAHGSATPAG
ncbi:MAG: DUF1707 and DUF4190 domain-containing protein [Streptosporangiaceae bacterium]